MLGHDSSMSGEHLSPGRRLESDDWSCDWCCRCSVFLGSEFEPLGAEMQLNKRQNSVIGGSVMGPLSMSKSKVMFGTFRGALLYKNHKKIYRKTPLISRYVSSGLVTAQVLNFGSRTSYWRRGNDKVE